MRKSERAEILRDRKWWKRLEKHLPWRLHGFTYRSIASFYTMPVRQSGVPLVDAIVTPLTNRRALIELTGQQRDQLIAALEAKP